MLLRRDSDIRALTGVVQTRLPDARWLISKECREADQASRHSLAHQVGVTAKVYATRPKLFKIYSRQHERIDTPRGDSWGDAQATSAPASCVSA
jgi:hypothetical protein